MTRFVGLPDMFVCARACVPSKHNSQSELQRSSLFYPDASFGAPACSWWAGVGSVGEEWFSHHNPRWGASWQSASPGSLWGLLAFDNSTHKTNHQCQLPPSKAQLVPWWPSAGQRGQGQFAPKQRQRLQQQQWYSKWRQYSEWPTCSHPHELVLLGILLVGAPHAQLDYMSAWTHYLWALKFF